MQKILDYLIENIRKSWKSVLSALYVLTNRPEYHEQMIEDAKTLMKSIGNRERPKSKKTTGSVQHIEQMWWIAYPSSENFSKRAIGTYHHYGLFIGCSRWYFDASRRSLDYALLKWKNYDKNSDNYYSRNKVISTNIKLRIIWVDSDWSRRLNAVLKKWLKINPSDYVLVSTHMNPLSSSQITRMLNLMFGKQVSVNMLRTYFDQLLQGHAKLTDIQNVASKMGHDVSTALEYVKKGDILFIFGDSLLKNWIKKIEFLKPAKKPLSSVVKRYFREKLLPKRFVRFSCPIIYSAIIFRKTWFKCPFVWVWLMVAIVQAKTPQTQKLC